MSVKVIDAKLDAKKISKRQAVPFLSDLPLVGYVAETETDIALLTHLQEGVREMGLSMIVFWKGGAKASFSVPEGITLVTPTDPHYASLWQACDMAFCMSEKATKNAFEEMIVPIAFKKIPLVQNYDPNREKGNAFTFEKITPWLMFAALVRACETFRFPFDWRNIVKNRIA